MTNRSQTADDTSETTDEDYLAEYGESHGRLNLSEKANPFLQGEPKHGQITRPEALRLIGEVLYAVRMPDGLVKIGWSTNLWLRLHRQDLRGATLLAIRAGDRATEQALHDSLADHVHHGREWYNPTPEVMAIVNGWRSVLGMEAVA